MQFHSDKLTWTMMRDSGVLRVVDNDMPEECEERVVKVWDKETKHFGGYRRVP